jgi:NADPH2:quinone reductase
VYIALMQGSRADIDLRLIMAKRLSVTGSTLRPLPLPEKAVLADELRQKAWPLLENGSVKPVICKEFPFSEAAEAHRLMESSAHIGKIVLTW